MANYARLEFKSADLASDFGRSWAAQLFGDDVLAQLPVLKSGPRKGKLKGYVHWVNCPVGGWSRAYGVVTPGKAVRAWLAPSAFSSESDAFRVQFNSRVQGCCLSRDYLFKAGRARLTAERQAELAALKAILDDRIQELEKAVAALSAALTSTEIPLVGPSRAAAESILAQNQKSLASERQARERLA